MWISGNWRVTFMLEGEDAIEVDCGDSRTLLAFQHADSDPGHLPGSDSKNR